MHADQTRRVPCPACETLLSVPPNSTGKYARCGKCEHRFQIPAEPDRHLSDDDVLMLLEGDEDEVDLETESQLSDESTDPGMSTFSAASGAPVATMHILKIRPNGVLLDFPADYLLDRHFQSAMPRMCMCCGTRANLLPHLLRFVPRGADAAATRQQHTSLVVKNPALQRLDNTQLLERLPEVPGAPPPANRPMPYWLCDQCRDVDIVAGQIKVDPQTQQGTCWLFVRNLHGCEEFIRVAAGDNVPDLDKLHELNESGRENPWDLIPESVKHRLEQWFRPEDDEQFLGYVPDRDHNRTEDGMAGILISNKRMIFHTHLRHMESKIDEPLKFLLAMSRDAGELQINTATWQIKRMKVDKEGIRGLRRALTMGKFRVAWK